MIELSILQIKTLIKSTEYYLQSKQKLNNTTNEEINDIKMLIWQLRDDLEREIKNKKIYGEQRYQFDIHQNYNSRSAKHTKRRYYRK